MSQNSKLRLFEALGIVSSVGLGWFQLACTKSEPQPATPQTAPNAVVTTDIVTAAASSVSAPSTTSPQANLTPAAPTATTGSAWPSALGTPTATPTADALPNGTPEPASDADTAPGLAGLAVNRESTKITGCLVEAPSKQAPTRSAPSSKISGETWRATAVGNSVLVTHTLEHACCLQGSAKATVTGSMIVVEEQLTGQPCRCLCESTIQTRVPAPPGSYDVQSVTVTNGQRQVIQTRRVTVGLRPHPAKGR